MPTNKSTGAELLTVRKVATLLNISSRSVRRLLAANELASFKIRGSVRIDRHDLTNYLKQSRIPDRRETVGE